MTEMGTLSIDAADRLAKRLVAKHHFPGASHAALEHLMAQGQVRKLAAWEVLCDEGDAGDEMWFLLRGTIEVQRKDLTGKLRELGTIEAPALIGHMALVDRSPRSATCVAQTDLELVVLDSSVYERLLGEGTISGSALRRLLLSSLSDQLVQANAQMRQLVDELAEDTPKPTAAPVSKATRRVAPEKRERSTEDKMIQMTARLGGWDANLKELEAMEREIELVVDEDQRRNRSKER
jgi:CRP-like cAMP-binding protein